MEPTARSTRKPAGWQVIVIAVIWITASAAGLGVMLNYDAAPAAPGTPPAMWPTESKIPRLAGLPAIVIMAHPHCPCTRATIGELALLMAHVQNRATAAVVFVRPVGFQEQWAETDLWQSAKEIPGVIVLSDANGVEASRFGAQASGQTMLYDANGKLQFNGGITASRGHSGDNAGRRAIVSLVNTGAAETTATSVFGCSLHDPAVKSFNGEAR
jgi:hypothetical protein